MTQSLLSIGECMVEMAATDSELFRQGFAGDTFNTAWHARRILGSDWDVQYFTAVGDDTFSARMLSFMAKENIGTRHVACLPGRTPGLYLISLNGGERTFTYWRDSSAARALADDAERLTAAVSASQTLFFSGITLAILPKTARKTLLGALARAHQAGKSVAFDSNIRPRLWQSRAELMQAIEDAARVTTLALPTADDEMKVFGDQDPEAVAQRYRAWGCAEVVVKSGPGPAIIWHNQHRLSIAPETRIVPVDTTGAGDSFNGAYLAARLSGETPEVAACNAHANAGRVIRAYGALI